MEGLEGSRRGRAVALALALAVVSLATACGDGERPRQTRPVQAQEAPRAFAPAVRLHPDEQWFPMDAESFIQRSTLKLRGEDRCLFLETVAVGRIATSKAGPGVPPLRSDKLGRAPGYRGRLVDEDCRRNGPVLSTLQHTRAFDPGRPSHLGEEEGYYLDILSDSYDGDPELSRRSGRRALASVPTYYEVVRARNGRDLTIVYWTLYGASLDYRPGEPRPNKHEGDWERVDVVLHRAGRRYAPVAVRLYEDEQRREVPWDDMEVVDDRGEDAPAATHPVVYAARDSHTPYHEPGAHDRREGTGPDSFVVKEQVEGDCGECVRVDGWRRLRSARRQPWYGYGGGWGLAFRTEGTSGPLGPSPFKL